MTERGSKDNPSTILGAPTIGPFIERAGPRAREGGAPAEPKTQFLGYAIEQALLDHISSVPPQPSAPQPSAPQPSAPAEPVRSSAEHTRFDFAVAAPAPLPEPSAEPLTTLPPLATTHIRSFGVPGTQSAPAQPLAPKLAPRLMLNEQDITVPQLKPSRALPIALGIALVALLIAGGVAAVRNPAAFAALRKTASSTIEHKLAAILPKRAQGEASPTAPAPIIAPAPGTAIAPSTAPAPRTALAPMTEPAAVRTVAVPALAATGLDAASVAALEKQAIERLIANDHRAALALYTQLKRVAPKEEAYGVMAALLARRIQPTCEGGAPCDH